MSIPLVKVFDCPAFSLAETLRYLRQNERDEKIEALIKECFLEAENGFVYKACYLRSNCKTSDNCVEIMGKKVKSKALAKNLSGVKEVVLFACSIGFNLDRLIEKYKLIDPSRSLIMHAIGVERVESLADAFCSFLAEEVQKENKSLRPRFSPGYGDFGIENQKLFFESLDVSKLLGVTLTESMLMSPSKSVTAIVGLADEKGMDLNCGCLSCDKECEYRR